MRGLGLTIAGDSSIPLMPYIPPMPESYPKPVKSGVRLPYYQTNLANGPGKGPNGEPGEYINGVFYPTYAGPITTSAPVVSVTERGDAGLFGLGSNTLKLILLGGLAYLILKK